MNVLTIMKSFCLIEKFHRNFTVILQFFDFLPFITIFSKDKKRFYEINMYYKHFIFSKKIDPRSMECCYNINNFNKVMGLIL